MKKIILLLSLLSCLSWGQAYPTAVATDANIGVLFQAASSQLAATMNATQTSFIVISGATFGDNTYVLIGNEVIFCTTLATNTFSGCTRGSNAVVHGNGSFVYGNQLAVTIPVINNLRKEVKAIENTLGANLSNVSGGGGTGCTPPSGTVGDLLVYAAGGDCTAVSAVTDAQVPDNITITLAATATALAANPTDCSAGQYADAIAANGNLTCAQVAFSQLSGTATDAQIPDNITISLAATATALASNPANCSAGSYPLGIAASGAVESCTVVYNQTIEDEGTPLTQRGTINFVGAGVAVTDVGGVTTVTISGSGGGSGCVPGSTAGKILVDDGASGCTSAAPTISGSTITATLSGNASTASALAANPTDCSANQFATAIAASGNLTCAQPAFTDISGTVTDAQVPDNITVTLAATATALAANGANCSGNNFALGVDASGVSECAQPAFSNLSGTASDAQIPDTITINLAATATTLASNPADCSSGQYANAIAANGDLTCAAVNITQVTNGVSTSRTLTGGAGIAAIGDLSADRTIATASGEADFLASGALTCGAATQGKMQVHTTPLQYCDNAATPTLQYAAYANSSGVATSATALAANGANCSGNNFALGVDASGVAECAQPAFSNLSGSATDAQIPDNITISLAATATALASNPSDCSAGQYATTIAASGDLTCAQVAFTDISGAVTDAQVPDTITASNYLPLSGGTITGDLVVQGALDVGDGTVAGETRLKELTANGTDYFSWLGQDSRSTILRAQIPSGDPTAGQVMRFGLPSSNTSAVTFGNAGGTGACSANQFETTDNNNAAPTCAQPSFSNLSGTATDAQIPDNITISLAATATALAANPADCSSGQYATTIAANGDLTCAAVNITQVTNGVSASTSDTFTNKTINVESTGNVVTTVQYPTMLAASCQNSTAGSSFNFGATAPTATCVAGSNTIYGTLSFPDTDGTYAIQGILPLTSDWTGNIDLGLMWRTSATSGDVVWQFQTTCVADAETGDPSFNTAQTVTDTAKGTTLQWNAATISTVTVTGCAAGERMLWKLYRDHTHASDTLAAAAELIELTFTTRRAQ